MRRTLAALPGVTAIAFRELSYPGKQGLNLTSLRFPVILQQRREARLSRDSSVGYLFVP